MVARSLMLLLDMLCIVASALMAFCVRAVFDPLQAVFILESPQLPAGSQALEYLSLLLVYILLVVLWLKNENLYVPAQRKRWQDEAKQVLRAVSLASLMFMVILYLAKTPISRFMVLVTWGLNAGSLLSWRLITWWVIARRVARGQAPRHVLIVGADGAGQELACALVKNQASGVAVKGFLDERRQGAGILGKIDDLGQVIQRHFIDEIIITQPSEQVMRRVAQEARRQRVVVKVVPLLLKEIDATDWQALELMGDVPVVRLHHTPIPELGFAVKRLIDLLGALVGLVLFAPVMCYIAITIKLDDGGPILYRSRRAGKKGRFFTCYKFRTMVPNADVLKEALSELNERHGPLFKITNDPRLTQLGRVLRKYSLDELPQFFNVLRGDMSLVGPRPPTPDEVDRYEGYTLEYYRRLNVRPGMTSLWGLRARNDPSFERAFELDCTYIEEWSLWLDFKIILQTIPAAFFRGEGR